jgi:hypothetical protein
MHPVKGICILPSTIPAARCAGSDRRGFAHLPIATGKTPGRHNPGSCRQLPASVQMTNAGPPPRVAGCTVQRSAARAVLCPGRMIRLRVALMAGYSSSRRCASADVSGYDCPVAWNVSRYGRSTVVIFTSVRPFAGSCRPLRLCPSLHCAVSQAARQRRGHSAETDSGPAEPASPPQSAQLFRVGLACP